jgi:hypothetical protein
MAQPVGRPVKRRWPAAGAASGSPVGGLVVLLGDDRGDASAAQQGPVGAAAVGLVGQHPIGSGTGTARATPRHPNTVQHPLELRGVAALAGGDHDRQRPLAALDGQVQLAAQPAPGAPERVVGRLGVDPARFFALPVPPLRAPAAC